MIRAKIPCKFAGKMYSAGEVVPPSAIAKKVLGELVGMEIIEVVDDPVETVAEAQPAEFTKQNKRKKS